jgi:hypothetical protein
MTEQDIYKSEAFTAKQKENKQNYILNMKFNK